MTTISAKTVLRSRNAAAPDKVLSTLLLRYPRCIHAEFMTHRQLSRNSASSRAIPTKKLIEDVINDPFVPLFWGKNQKGMQAGKEHNERVWSLDTDFAGSDRRDAEWKVSREDAWLTAKDHAVSMALRFEEAGYHKQIVNRLIEPFMHITVLASGTEWSNFLSLRDHKDAEPHIQVLAREVRKCLEDESTIQTLQPGEWHLPFTNITNEDGTVPMAVSGSVTPWGGAQPAIKLSVARCASTSYKTVDGFDMTLERAVELHDKLVGSEPLHASPCEHVAQADDWTYEPGLPHKSGHWGHRKQHGNFKGFRQYRKMLPGECQ
jgi:hypothetical protein